MNKVLEGLFIGNLGDARDIIQLTRNQITHIISIHESETIYKGITSLNFDVSNSPFQPIIPVFGECLEFIHRARAEGGVVLVYCLSGVSRSATIIAAYILVRTKLSSGKAIQIIKAVRPCVNPNYGFQRQLEDWSHQGKKKWKKLIKMWPEVNYNDRERCSNLLALYNSKGQSDKKLHITSADNPNSNHIVSVIPEDSKDPKSKTAVRDSAASGDSDIQTHVPITMGNTGSVSTDSLDSGNKKAEQPTTRIDRVRSAIRNSINRKSSKEVQEKNTSKEDKANNNNNGTTQTGKHAPNGTYYPENITRSTTLPNDVNKINRINGDMNFNINANSSAIQARLLPAYKSEQQVGIIGNIQQRQKIMSSPTYIPSARQRTHSQSSTYSHRYSNFRRVTTTHIPDHIDKRMVRSRSVGVIPDAELRMHKTTSASVVKLADCEDWIV